MDEDRLLELRRSRESAESAYAVAVTPLSERLELTAGDPIDWDVDAREGELMLVFGRPAEYDRSEAAYPRRLREGDGEVLAPVPDQFLEADPPRGLGLDLEPGDDASLLFDSVAMERTVGLLPVRFEDGTPYEAEPLPDAPERSDPIAEAALEHGDATGTPEPRPETLDAPIDPEVIEATLQETDVAYEHLASALEELSRRRLVGEADAVADYPPLALDDRGICVVDPEVWTDRLADQLAVDGATLQAARTAHVRQATALLSAADAPKRAREYREFDEAYDAVVTDERETAEWEAVDADASR